MKYKLLALNAAMTIFVCLAGISRSESATLDPQAIGDGDKARADLNRDGQIDQADVAWMRDRFYTDDAAADLNGDGQVNFPDLAILKEAIEGPATNGGTSRSMGGPTISLDGSGEYLVGEIITFTMSMDFTGDPTLGGGTDVMWDPGLLGLVSWDPIPYGDPGFSQPGTIGPDNIDSFAFGDFNGLEGPADIATITFEMLTAGSTTIDLSVTDGAAGPFVSSTTFQIQDVTFIDAEVTITDPADVDEDGVDDSSDNCLNSPNPEQADFDGDGSGDVCDGDNALAYVVGFDTDNFLLLDLASGNLSETAVLNAGDEPRGITVGKDGQIFVAIRGGAQNIVSFAPDGTAFGAFTDPLAETGPGMLGLNGINELIAGGARMAVAYRYDNQAGGILDIIANPDEENRFFTGILVADDILYAADSGAAQSVFRVDLNNPANLVEQIVTPADAPIGPVGMTIGHTGNLFVSGQRSIKEYAIDTGAPLGDFVADFADLGLGTVPGRSGALVYSESLGAYLITTRNDSIYVLNRNAALLRTYSSPLLNGAFGIVVPSAPPGTNASIDLSTDPVQFPLIASGETAFATLTVTNSGNSLLLMGGAENVTPPAAPFSLSDNGCDAVSLAPAESCDVVFAFSPSTGGTYSDTYEFISNDPDAPLATVQLFGQVDLDADGLADTSDNCTLVANPDQRDTDSDGIGNVCDPDLNNDCLVNFIDLGSMKAQFFQFGDIDEDLDGDGVVNFIDLGIMAQAFFSVPGPSGVANFCTPICGDQSLDNGEQCDDGNTMADDGCSAVCEIEFGWTCTVPMAPGPSVCEVDCGDGVVFGSEACDDGNTMGGDGCSPSCTIEDGWECAEPVPPGPSECVATCGNGVVDVGETCDDANTVAGDGCSSECQIEPDWVCTVPAPPGPSLCAECIEETFGAGPGELSGWTLFNTGAAGLNWGTTDSGTCVDFVNLENYTGGLGEAACIEDYGFVNVPVDAFLCSPEIHLGGSSQTQLSFLYNYQVFQNDPNDKFEVLVGTVAPSAGTVGNFESVFLTSEDAGAFQSPPGAEATLDLSAYDAEESVWVCFRYSALRDRYAQVDNVAIGPQACVEAAMQRNR